MSRYFCFSLTRSTKLTITIELSKAELVGETLDIIGKEEVAVIVAKPASELILNVDGGHIKTTEDKRSIEAMTSVIYRPEALESNIQETRNYIGSKH
ncbi:MAG: hypothetical protein QG556_503 [Pseudomonadota bacterium]|nr:hypothetical protein [Pseudomonadota bacterium]